MPIKRPFKRFVRKERVVAKVSETRQGIEIEETVQYEGPVTATEIRERVSLVDGYNAAMASLIEQSDAAHRAGAVCAYPHCTCSPMHLCPAAIDELRRIDFDAMSPADQAIQIIAGADPDGVARRRIALEQSKRLQQAVEDARAFQAGHRYE